MRECNWFFVPLVLCSHALGLAQETGPEVDQDAVRRMGNVVQHVGDGFRSSWGVDAFVDAMGPPASDADKWFISVLTTRNCPACEKLKSDWARNAWLLALAHPTDPKQSWSHFNYYDRDDKSQAFRFGGIRVTTYPTILVQPPRTGRFGDAKTVVFQGVYDGNPAHLARDITAAIRRYVEKVEASKAPLPLAPQKPPAFIGLDPPWMPAPKPEPFPATPVPVFPAFDPTIPPRQPSLTTAWPAVLWSVLGPVAGAAIVWLLLYVRNQRVSQGKPTLVDEHTLQEILALVRKLAHTPDGPHVTGVPKDRW